MNNIYLFIGKSGSGKTTVVSELEKRYGFRQLQSYTTRPPREPNEVGHTFVSNEEFDKLKDIVAYTEFDGYRYCATKEQVDNSDLYVIDPYGVKTLLERYHGAKGVKIIYLVASYNERKQRMYTRGDNKIDVAQRLAHDEIEGGFYRICCRPDCGDPDGDKIPYDLPVLNEDLNMCVNAVYNFINECEKEAMHDC